MRKLQSTALGISVISILFNSTLTLLKFVVGIFGNSYALISDAIHSSADVFSSMIVAVGIGVSEKAKGYEQCQKVRVECVTAIVVALILAVTGLVLAFSSITTIADGDFDEDSTPTFIASIMAFIPVIAKELMYRYEKHMANKMSSDALLADAIHHRADAWISTGVLTGVIGGYFGYPIIDTIAGFIVSLLILKVSYEIFSDNKSKLLIKTQNKTDTEQNE